VVKFDFGLFGYFSLFGLFLVIGVVSVVLLVFIFMLVDFFDIMGIVVVIGEEGGLLDVEGNFLGVERIFVVDLLVVAVGGVVGILSNMFYIELVFGVGEGVCIGLVLVVIGVLFLFAIFLVLFVLVVFYEVVIFVLVVVGFLMM